MTRSFSIWKIKRHKKIRSKKREKRKEERRKKREEKEKERKKHECERKKLKHEKKKEEELLRKNICGRGRGRVLDLARHTRTTPGLLESQLLHAGGKKTTPRKN